MNDINVLSLAFSSTKRAYSAIADVSDLTLIQLFQDIRGNPDRKRVLLECKHLEPAQSPLSKDSVMEAINQGQLLEGWGDFLLSLTTPLIEGIPLGISSTVVATYTGDLCLTLLLKLVIIYALFSESTTEKEGTHLGAIMQAQELFNLLTWMPRLRNGGTRLLPRLVKCIENIVNTHTQVLDIWGSIDRLSMH